MVFTSFFSQSKDRTRRNGVRMEIVDDESAQESYCYCSRSAVHCMQLGLSVSVSSTEYK